MTVFLSIITALIVFIASCVLFNINFDYKSKFLKISIKTEKDS
ncbi:hypothetical protein [Thermoanaerobacter sp. X514]|nr:hypothetical protein [Thermoanaerobacter sp. X514]